MKLPEVNTKRKIRDFRICQKYLEGFSQDEIAQEFGVTQQRIAQILYKNRDLLILDKNYEKIKRISWLKGQLRKRGDSKKDSADLHEQIRDEIEGLQNTGLPSVQINVSPQRTYVFTSDPGETDVRGVFDSESENRITDTEPSV